jgi:serine/threonine protein kinase
MDPLAADDPRQVGPYRLQGRLGAGGMGQVFLGVSPAGRAVAVKVVRPELARDPEFVRRFRREVTAAKAVSGAFTAPVVAADPDGDPPWLATAFVPGPSLADAIAMIGPLPPEAVWRLAGGLVEALQAVHVCGLVHRDLKPANVLLSEDGPRVIDFGISRAMEGTAITAASAIVGTPAFMSPEQVSGLPIGQASDIFALGSVVAFAATGTVLFGEGEPVAIPYRVVHLQPDLTAIPAGLRELVSGCLAKDPVARPTLGRLLDTITAGLASYPAPSPGTFWPPPLVSLVSTRQHGFGADIRPGPGAVHAHHAAQALTDTRSHQASRTRRHGEAAGRVSVRSDDELVTPPGRPAVEARQPQRGRARLRWRLLAWVAVVIVIGGVVGLATTLLAAGAGHRSPGAGHHTSGAGRPASPPAVPTHIVAVPTSQYTIQVTWRENSPHVTGYRIDNGCPVGSCPRGATLTGVTKGATSVSFDVTPGAYDCFRVQALNDTATSPWSGYGCTSTPGIAVFADMVWQDTSVYLTAGDALGITASGTVRINGTLAVGPNGEQSCVPSRNYPNASPPYLAPVLPCFSLIARIGNASPFEVGTSTIVVTTSGYLYLSVNDNEFAANAGSWTADIKIGG